MAQLLTSEEAKAILARRFPDMMDSPYLVMGMGFSLEQIAGLAPEVLTEEVMQSIAEELAQLAPVVVEEVAAPRLSLVQRLLMRLARWRARCSA